MNADLIFAERVRLAPMTVDEHKTVIRENLATYYARNGQDAAIADPAADLGKLAERIACRVGYPKADKECFQAARMMLKEVNCVKSLLSAYDRLEQEERGRESFFVAIAQKNPAAWQVRSVIAEAKRGAPIVETSMLNRWEREQDELRTRKPKAGTIGALMDELRAQGQIE